MRPSNNLEWQVVSARHIKNTAADFMRGFREQNAADKQVTEEAITQAEHAISRALTVWVDDGGTAA